MGVDTLPHSMYSSRCQRLRTSVAAIAIWVTAAVFLFSGTSKLFRISLSGTAGLPIPIVLEVLLSGYEVALGFALLGWPSVKRIQCMGVLTLLAFTLYSLRLLPFAAVLDCGCGLPGFLTPTSPVILVARNLLLLTVALFPLMASIWQSNPIEYPSGAFSTPTAALLTLLLLQASFLSANSNAHASSADLTYQPSLNRPVFLGDEVARRVDGVLEGKALDMMLVYVSPDCRACIEACSDIATLVRESRTMGIATVILTSGDLEGVRGFGHDCAPETPIMLDPGHRLAQMIGVRSTPHLAIVRNRSRLVAVGWADVIALVGQIKALQSEGILE